MKEFQQTKQIAPRMGKNLSQLDFRRRLIYRIYTKRQKLNTQEENCQSTKTNRQFSKEETQAVGNYCKKWSVSLSRGRCELKLLSILPPASQKSLLSRWLITKSEDVERDELLLIAKGRAIMEINLEVPQKTKGRVSSD